MQTEVTNFGARGWDHNVSNHTDWTISNQFSIVNQEPVITQFTLEGIAYGDGSTSSNRAWLSTPLEGDLNFSWSVLDDDLSHASLGNTRAPEVYPMMDQEHSIMLGVGHLEIYKKEPTTQGSRSMITVVFRFQIRSLSVLTVHLQR